MKKIDYLKTPIGSFYPGTEFDKTKNLKVTLSYPPIRMYYVGLIEAREAARWKMILEDLFELEVSSDIIQGKAEYVGYETQHVQFFVRDLSGTGRHDVFYIKVFSSIKDAKFYGSCVRVLPEGGTEHFSYEDMFVRLNYKYMGLYERQKLMAVQPTEIDMENFYEDLTAGSGEGRFDKRKEMSLDYNEEFWDGVLRYARLCKFSILEAGIVESHTGVMLAPADKNGFYTMGGISRSYLEGTFPTDAEKRGGVYPFYGVWCYQLVGNKDVDVIDGFVQGIELLEPLEDGRSFVTFEQLSKL